MRERVNLPRGLPDEAYELGELLDEFSIGARRTASKIILGLATAALGVATLAILGICAGNGMRLRSARSAVGLAILGAGLILVGLATAVGVLRVRGTRVLVCRSGLIYSRRTAEVVRWDGVKTLRYEAGQHGEASSPRFTVRRHRDGREFAFNNFLPRISSLGYFIERRTLAHLLPPALEAFNKRELLCFGPLALSHLGIRRGDNWLYWNAVSDVTFDRAVGDIIISGGAGGPVWHKQRVDDVPNYHVFLEIARARLKE
jgi:hypothetical protein